MLEPSWWLWGAVLPLLTAAAVMIGCLQPWRSPSAIRSAIAWPLAVSLGYLVGSVVFLAIKHSLAWPPVEASDFLAMVVLPAAVVIEIFGAIMASRTPVVRLIGRAMVILATPPLMLLPFLKNDWSVGQSIGYCGALSVAMAAVWVLIHLAASRRLADHDPLGRGYEEKPQSLATWLALMIVAAGVGMTILATGSVTLGQLGLTLAAAMFGAWGVGVFSYWKSAKPQAASGGWVSVSGGGGGLAVVVVMLAGLLITGCFYAEVKTWYAVVLALAPLAACLGRVPAIRKLRGWHAGLIIVVATGLVVAAAVVPAVLAAARAMSESGYE